MASMIDPKCGANISVLEESDVRKCAVYNFYVFGGIIFVVVIGFLMYIYFATHRLNTVEFLLFLVAAIAVTVCMRFIVDFLALRSKQSQQFEMEGLQKSGMTAAQAMQTSFAAHRHTKSSNPFATNAQKSQE